MKILITGSSGMVGQRLLSAFASEGHKAVRLLRSGAGTGDIVWNFTGTPPRLDAFEGFDAVVHLAGENIAQGKWTIEKKARIRSSRVDSTKNLVNVLMKLKSPPKVFISASAIGFYGDRGANELTEKSAPGQGFLARVCQEWEAASAPLKEKACRVVNLRFGVVLSKEGGALAKMLLPFKMGLGGVVGSGKQFMSWVSLQDAVKTILVALQNPSLEGPVNVVAPSPITNRDFTMTLGRVLGRPTLFPMPAFLAKLIFGEMAEALLLASTRVVPEKLIEAEFVFNTSTLEACLKKLLR